MCKILDTVVSYKTGKGGEGRMEEIKSKSEMIRHTSCSQIQTEVRKK